MSSKLESGQTFAARYVLLRKLANGPDVGVWLARDEQLDEERVLKIIDPAAAADGARRAGFLRALRAQQSVRHPNVLACEAVGEQPRPFGVFRYVPDGDVSRLRGRAWQDVIGILRDVAQAAAAVNAAGFVHRDLKLSNVMLDADGRALLSDFGIAARVGDAVAPAAGSPFTASPQQVAGEPPAIADDVYSYGTLAYELLSGYPPSYPDATETDRQPAPLRTRTPLPERLERLVMACLSPAAADRPTDFRQVIDELAVTTPVPAEGRADLRPRSPVQLQVPPSAVEPIDASWPKRPDAGPSESELRSQGFRRGLVAGVLVILLLLAGLVLFALPRWVDRQANAKRTTEESTQAPATQPTAPTAEASEAPDLEQLAELKRRFEELQPELNERYRVLTERGAAQWGGERYPSAGERLAEADGAAASRRFEEALGSLRAADDDIAGLEKLAGVKLSAALAAGDAAFEAGDAAEAQRQFALALQIDPTNVAAGRGLERTSTLDEVRGLLAEAASLERAGKSQEALQRYAQALELDPATQAARDAVAAIKSRLAGNAFAAAVAEGIAAFSRDDFEAARRAFNRAAALRPGSPEVTEGLARIERALDDRRINAHLQRAGDAERQEQWSLALAEYRKALDIDRKLLAAQQGVERSEPRAMIDAELSTYLDRPDRLFTAVYRDAARKSLQKAESVTVPGPVLQRQIESLSRLIAAAEKPVQIALASDNQTEVTIYRVGRLGAFEQKSMELLPGKYTVVGSRKGYRDVRRELTVLPGSPPPVLEIRCEDKI